MKENYLEYENIIIRIVCEIALLQALKEEYGDYYSFNACAKQIDFNVFICIDSLRYEKVLKNINLNNSNLIYLKDRNGIIIKKNRNEIFILYDKITDNLIQFIGENIISIFGLYMERNGYSYYHAACVEKNSNGIAIIGERNSGKTTILNILLQEGFNFVSNSHLGMKTCNDNIIALGSPSRMGIRFGTLETVLSKKTKMSIIENTEFKDKFSNDIQNHLSSYKSKKFNIKVNELKQIYSTNLVNKTILKVIMVPFYMPEIEHMQIKKLNIEEKREVLLKNSRNGSYDTIRYIDDLFNNKKNSLCNIENIPFYKLYQNEKNTDELLNFIHTNLKNGSDNN